MEPINDYLLKYLLNPTKDFQALNYKIFGNSDIIKSFLTSKSDIKRIIRSERAAYSILIENDLPELIYCRRKIRDMELGSNVFYPNQKDHTAHTLYVYLLGYYFGTSLIAFRDILNKKTEPDSFFHSDQGTLNWVYASLLHDVGYFFTEHYTEGLELLENYFSEQFIFAQIDQTLKIFFLFDSPLDEFKKTQNFSEFISFIKNLINKYPKPNYSSKDPSSVIQNLQKINWYKELGLNSDNLFSIFEFERFYSEADINKFQSYIAEVARVGYSRDSEPVVDHAFASGAFLFQYSTFWYYLINESDNHFNHEPWYKDFKERIWGPYNYPLENLKTSILPGIFACCAHNLNYFNQYGAELLPIKLEKSPLLYLTILCDEIQNWDRIPSGNKAIGELENIKKRNFSSEEIYIEEVVPNNRIKLTIRLNLFDYCPENSDITAYNSNFRQRIYKEVEIEAQREIDKMNLNLRKKLFEIDKYFEIAFELNDILDDNIDLYLLYLNSTHK